MIENQIFKIAILENNIIKKFLFFIGDQKKESIDTISSGIANVDIQYINSSIYYDDTIDTLKKKILKNYNSSYQAIYLFVKYKEIFNAKSSYNNLTNFGRNDLDKAIEALQ